MKKVICMILALLLLGGCASEDPTLIAGWDEDEYSAVEGDEWEAEEPEADEYALLEAETLQYPGQNDEWKYNVYETYVSVKGYIGEPLTDGTLCIPDTIDGLPVRKIASSCFGSLDSEVRESIHSVILPAELAIIGSYAFEDLTALETVQFQDDDKVMVGSDAFSKCDRLQEIDNILEHMANDVLPMGCFSYCDTLLAVVIPDHIKEIGRSAFSGCENLTYVYLGNVQKVDQYAFLFTAFRKGDDWIDCTIIVRNANCEFDNKAFLEWEDGVDDDFSNLTIIGHPGSTAAQLASYLDCKFEPITD